MKKLEIGNFLVRDIVFGEKTAYEGGIQMCIRDRWTGTAGETAVMSYDR